jgi:hypothetical protein
MILKKGTFSLFPCAMCKGLHPYQQVLMAWLCKHSNEDGVCWPSLNTLAKECGMSRRSVVTHLQALEKMGFLLKQHRLADGEFLSNNYKVILFESAGDALPHTDGALPPVHEVHTNYNQVEQKPVVEILESTPSPCETIVSPSATNKKINVPYKEIIALYEELLGDTLPSVISLSEQRKKTIAARFRTELPTLEAWRKFFTMVKKSDFLMGRTTSCNRAPFLCGFDWLIKQGNCLKILEHTYSSGRT